MVFYVYADLCSLLAATSQFSILIGQKMQLTGCHNGNEMRNTTCVDTKISIEWPYCSFLYCVDSLNLKPTCLTITYDVATIVVPLLAIQIARRLSNTGKGGGRQKYEANLRHYSLRDLCNKRSAQTFLHVVLHGLADKTCTSGRQNMYIVVTSCM